MIPARCFRGRACWNERTPESLQRAIEYFTLAVDTDPEYGLAFAGLADAYTTLSFYDIVSPSDVMPRAKAAAERAVDRDPDLPEGHASLGLVSSIWDFDWAEAGRRLRKVGDLPRGEMAQWRRWCLDPEYAVGAEGAAVRERYAAVRAPLVSISFTDDEYMSARNTASLHGFYSNAPQVARRISPADAGVPRIGHFGFFRERLAEPLWRRYLLPELDGPPR